MQLIDTHCHLDLNHFDQDRDGVIARAIEAGVEYVINPGINIPSSRTVLELSGKYPQILPAVGIHPNDVTQSYDTQISELRSILRNERIVAIGEIGLDDYHKIVPMDLQIRVFKMQLALAAEWNLPVIIHSRDTLEVITPLLSKWVETLKGSGQKSPYGVMHSFEGDFKQAEYYYQMGFMISIAGPVTYKNATTKHELVKNIPMDGLLLETDSPYLTPVPFRGLRNEPAYLPQIAQRTAIIRVCDEADIAIATTRNASTLFHLGVNH